MRLLPAAIAVMIAAHPAAAQTYHDQIGTIVPGVQPIGNSVGSANFATAQATVGTSPMLILAARTGIAGTGRIAVTLYNAGTATVFVGAANVTSSTGVPLVAGGALTIDTTAAVYGVVASGSAAIGALETY